MAADVQKEHGHSPIAHPIMEALALAPFSAAQLKVVLHVIRQTYGWSRKDAQIPYGEFRAATALHKDTVRGAVKKLVLEGVLLEVEPATFQRPATYRMQKDPQEWGAFHTSPPSLTQCDVHHTPGDESHRGVGHTSHTPVGHTSHSQGTQVPETTTTSKTLKQGKTRESKKRDANASLCAGAPQSWSEQAGLIWEQRMGGTAPYGRIGRALKPLTDQNGEEEVLLWWDRYLENQVERGEAKFATPEAFAQRYGAWKEELATGRLTKADRRIIEFRRSVDEVDLEASA